MRMRLVTVLGIVGLTGLTGCFSSVRHVPKVQLQAPESYKTADVAALEKTISQRDEAIKTLQASVLVTATTGGERTGKEKTFTSFRGYIFLQKPRDLRVILQLPFVGSKAMDMVSDGGSFTLVIPPKSVAYLGSDRVKTPSAKGLENLRPAVFLDSLLVPAVQENEFVVLTEGTRVVSEGKGRRPALEEPEYALQVQRTLEGKLQKLERVIHISRVNLLPYKQEVYDADGQVVTQAVYENYQVSAPGEQPMPHTVTISRPLDQYTLRIDVTKLTMNAQFETDQFEAPKIPATYKVIHME